MSIPLIQKPEKDDINTSIIAIKRNIERINMLLGLSNSEEIDTSKFATKEELQQAVTDLQPVDEVTVDNMHSVSSNAVYNKVFPKYDNLISIPSGTSWTATEDCYCVYTYVSMGSVGYSGLTINNVLVSVADTEGNFYFIHFSGFIRKGQIVSTTNSIDLSRSGVFKAFKV